MDFNNLTPYPFYRPSSKCGAAPSIEETSIELGVPPGRTFFRVVLPPLRPGVAEPAVVVAPTRRLRVVNDDVGNRMLE